ncbi:MAG: hypothetical protein M3N13_04860 [Candidatus Eremiobacteraeota bacterium]|nr:hypothetical protein [Candidatus Eremiobacteraeota bacterium]
MLFATCALVFAVSAAAIANENPSFQKPTYSGPMNAAEKALVAAIQADLGARFPTAVDAEKAGYVRYTSEDSTGAISYADKHWQSLDLKHPSQLWYDKHGRLLGADFSRLKTGTTRPTLWGVNPGRWWEFDRHMHWVMKDPLTGKMTYDFYAADDDWVGAGGSLSHPDAATLVKLGKVKNARDVAVLFNFPAVWDLIVWVTPNPNGAFAQGNPLVKP